MTLFVDVALALKEIEIFNNLLIFSLRLMLLFAIVVNVVTTSSVMTRFLSLFSLSILIA